MKIAHLTTVDMSLRYLVLPQLLAAAERGEAIGISAPGPYVEELEALGIRHVPLRSSTRGADPMSDVKSAIQLWKILKDEQVDILHTHNPKPGVYGRIVGRLAGVPIVVNTIHGLYASDDSPRTKRAVVYGLEWLASRFSDVELIQNSEDYQMLVRSGITPKSKTRLLGNGVDLSRFNLGKAKRQRAAIRDELGVEEGTVVVGMVGRLVLEKGIPELVVAAESLGQNYVVVVVGPHDPAKSDALPHDVIARGEAAGVRFLGMRTDVERLYSGFDLFVLPSHREGFPRAAMEAAASGLPVVATDIRGCRQVVEDGVTGELFPVGDSQALTNAIRRIGDDRERRLKMGEASASKAIQEFDEARVVERVVQAYEDAASAKGLDWALVGAVGQIRFRSAKPADSASIAELHRQTIDTGFLSSLGHGFLSLLYEGLVTSEQAHVRVAEVDGAVVAFIAGTFDTGAFYRSFIRRYGLRAVLRIFPALFRLTTIRRLWETFSYGAEETRAKSELLSMAVAPIVRRRGVGQRLVADLFGWALEQGIRKMTVIVAQSNEPATRLYNNAGFVNGRRIEVHRGTPSWEFLWSG